MAPSTADDSQPSWLRLSQLKLLAPYGPGNHELQNKDVFTTFLPQLPCGQSQLILRAQGQPGAFSDSGTSTQHLHKQTLPSEVISAPPVCFSTSRAAQKSDATRENFGLNTGKRRHNQGHLFLRFAVPEKRPGPKCGSLRFFFILSCSVGWLSSNDVITTSKCPSQATTHLAHYCRTEIDTGFMAMLISAVSFTKPYKLSQFKRVGSGDKNRNMTFWASLHFPLDVLYLPSQYLCQCGTFIQCQEMFPGTMLEPVPPL